MENITAKTRRRKEKIYILCNILKRVLSALAVKKEKEKMKYDPIKKSLGTVFNKRPFLRKIFYRLLDLLLLRTWHIKKAIRKWKKKHQGEAFILDAGSGFGQYTYYLSKQSKNWKILGVDVKQEQIDDCNRFFKQIKKSARVQFKYADLTKFKRKLNSI